MQKERYYFNQAKGKIRRENTKTAKKLQIDRWESIKIKKEDRKIHLTEDRVYKENKRIKKSINTRV